MNPQFAHAPIADLPSAIAFIAALIRDEPRNQALREQVALTPIERLLRRLNDPHRTLTCLHIAGSKGKGSTALAAERLAATLGLRTGVYTSPHLTRWTERYRIDGEESSPALFAHCIEQVRSAVRDVMAHEAQWRPSFFDVLTAAAFVMFDQAAVDLAILETGLGGRLDATNIVQPSACCITSIELEHTDKLGDTIAQIAREKAGIIKPRVPVVIGAVPAEATAVIRARANQVNASILQLGREVPWQVRNESNRASVEFSLHRRRFHFDVDSGQAGLAGNAVLAALGVHSALGVDVAELQKALPALETLYLPARLEFVRRAPWVLVDGAHTDQSVALLTQAMEACPAKRIRLLVSVSGTRDPGGLMAPLLRRSNDVTVTQADPARSMPASALATQLRYRTDQPVTAVADPVAAAKRLAAELRTDDLLVVAGSMYLAGRVRDVLK